MRMQNHWLASLAVFGLVAGPAGLSGCGSASSDHPGDPAQIQLTITSPAPSAELLSSDNPTITVTGTVATSDPDQGALEAFVNGVRAEVKDGAFTAELTPEVGVNHIKVEGGDGIADLVTQELDVMWAPGYLPPTSGQTGFDLPGAVALRLGQRFLDARLLGTTLDLSTDPVVARDVASALELILWQVNLAGLLSGPIDFGSGDASLHVEIQSATPSNITVDARIIDTPERAIDLKIDLGGVFLAMNGSFRFGSQTLAISGGIKADLHATARLMLGTAAGGGIQVGLGNVTATIGPPEPHFQGTDGETLNGLVNAANTDFSTLIEGLLTTQLIPTFTERVPPLLQSLLGAADTLVHNVQVPIDTGFGPAITLTLDGHLGALDVAAGATSGHVTVGEDLAIQTSGTPIHPASRGAVRVDPAPGDPVFSTAGVHLAVHMDFLNALLHALWNAGLLEGHVTTGGIDAMVSAHLAPVIRPTPASSPCQIEGKRCDVVVQLGQLELQLPTFAQSFVLSASAGARIEIDGGTVKLAIESTPELRVWETSAVPGTFTADTVKNLITTLVWPQLFGAIGNNLSFALPLPDLATLGLGDLAPGLANAQLMLEARQRPTFSAGELILGADLVLSTPKPR